MPNPVIEEAGKFSHSIPVTLTFHSGATLATRGVIAILPQSPGQLEGTFSDSGRCAWVADPGRPADRVEFLSATLDGESRTWRVLDSQPTGGGIGASVNWRTVRYMLIEDEVAVVQGMDFDLEDFDAADFG